MSRPSETFTFLPLTVTSSPSDKIPSVSISEGFPPKTLPSGLSSGLASLNALHKILLTSEATSQIHIPPPPVPVNPKRSGAISKLRASGNEAYKARKFADAIRYYSLGIDMALARPPWEPSALVKDELFLIYANRSQAYMATGNWPEGLVDAEASVDCKKVGNPKAHWRKGKCLKEMGRLEEARDALELGMEFGGEDADLKGLFKEVEEALERRRVP